LAAELYEDLYALGKSSKLKRRINEKDHAINISGVLTGITARRADGTFGERNPSAAAVDEPGYAVARSHLATIEIGAEVKIFMKSMGKQVGRVIGILNEQLDHFKHGGNDPLSVAIVAVNHADKTTSYEGERAWPTDGKEHKHPIQESAKIKEKLIKEVKPFYNEFLFLNFKATNVEPYYFEWVNRTETLHEYGAVLTRISRKYDQRF
jgi:hypothetical protein